MTTTGAAQAQSPDSSTEADGPGYTIETSSCSLGMGWGSASKGSVGEKPAAPTLDDSGQFPVCKIQWDGEDLLYICQCARAPDPKSGALEVNADDGRPRLSQICGEQLRNHCGEVRQRVVRECENPQGRCKVRAIGIDGTYPSSQLSVDCRCEGERGWSYEERGSKKPDYTLAQLDELCAQELAECPGNNGSGIGNGFDLPQDENFNASASCRFEQGSCRVSRTPQKSGYIECECDNRFEIRSSEQDLFDQFGTDKLLDYCDGQMYECEDMLLAGKGPTGDWTVKVGKPGEEDEDPKDEVDEEGNTPGDHDKPDGDSDDHNDAKDEGDEKAGGSPGLDIGGVLEGLGCQASGSEPSMLGLIFAGLLLLRRKKA